MRITVGDLHAPILYVWWRGDVALYVGMSMQGILRLRRQHERLRAALTTDHIEIRFYPRLTKAQVEDHERALIAKLKPVLNLHRAQPEPRRSRYEVLPRGL